MILADQHMHTVHSPDGRGSIEEMAEAALAQGLRHICLTDHMDTDIPLGVDAWPELDADAYRAHFLQVQQQYAGRLSMSWGVEYGMQPHLTGKAHEFLTRNPFDFVIGSCHTTNGKLPTDDSFFEGRSTQAALREYFEDLAHCAALFDDYDVCGHIDYVVRYCPDKDDRYHYADYADVLDTLLRTLIDKGKGIEANTRGFAKGLREMNPCNDILRRYRQLGGEIITIGSDAHAPAEVAGRFDRAREMLLDCGFRYYCIFKKHQPQYLAL